MGSWYGVHTIDRGGLSILRISKSKRAEHIETGDSNAFTPLVLSISIRLNKAPVIASTGIKEHGNKEQIDQATSKFQVISSGALPLINHALDAWHIADLEVLPTTVGWDRVIFVGPKITLAMVISSSSRTQDLARPKGQEPV